MDHPTHFELGSLTPMEIQELKLRRLQETIVEGLLDHKLTADEVRLIEEKRAEKAMEERPTPKTFLLAKLISAISSLAVAGKSLDPLDGSWDELIKFLNKRWAMKL